MLILGFDEAGRGSVLGPMVVGAYLVDSDRVDAVRDAGGRDSKGMSAVRRASHLPGLRELAEASEAIVLSAAEIDLGNLNALEEQVFTDMAARWKPDMVQIDAPVPPAGLSRFHRRMAEMLRMPQQRLQVANQAEDRFPAVGAASILAKVTRDQALEDLRQTYGDLGSGYPSDPGTRRFLTGLLETGDPLPDFVRSRWDTVRKIREEIAIRTRQGRLF